MIMSCNNKAQSEYNAIKNSGLHGEALYNKVLEFDNLNPAFFESKLDLASFYYISNDSKESWKYLLKSEPLLSSADNKNKALFYGLYATLSFDDNDFEKAWEYVQKALSIKKEGEKYGYLAGQIQLAREQKEDALALFERTYSTVPELITAQQLRAYMYLLATGRNYVKCREILELYFEKGTYFSGLGLFASGVYEHVGEWQKSIFSAYLDYEYQASYGNANDTKFLENLSALEKKLPEADRNGEAKKAVETLRDYYTNKRISALDTDFFAYKYLSLKQKIENKTATQQDFNTFLSLEKYFTPFPVYYWLIWQCAKELEPQSAKQWIPILEKIILLNSNTQFARNARIQLGMIQNLTESDSKKILLPNETEFFLNSFINTGKREFLQPVFELLSLPDCTYIYNALEMLRVTDMPLPLKNELKEELNTASGRLKDRLSFILS